jgi:hypothetical protein
MRFLQEDLEASSFLYCGVVTCSWKHIEESADFVLAGLSFVEVPEEMASATESNLSNGPLPTIPAPAMKVYKWSH